MHTRSPRFPEARRTGRRHLHRRAVPAPPGRGPGQRLLLRAALRHALGLQGRRPTRTPRARSKRRSPRSTRLRQQPDFIVFTGDLTHTTDDPKERRAAHGANSRRSSSALQRQGRALHAGRARRVARQRRGVQGVLRRDALHLRPQGRAFHRARQRLRSRRRRSATSSSPGSRPTSSSASRTTASSSSRTGRCSTSMPQWDWATRDGAKAIELLMPYQNVDGVLRPHPPGASPHDGPHRAPRGEVADLPAAGAGLAARSARRCPSTPRYARPRHARRDGGRKVTFTELPVTKG